ncbi:MAG: hypothetical protein WCC22_17245 [Terriglobales bacterium]
MKQSKAKVAVAASGDFWLSPRYRASAWNALHLDIESEVDWPMAIDIVEDRIMGRFVRWIDQIEDVRFSGFAVMALDCLLIETLVGFITGRPSKGPDALLEGQLTDCEFHFTKDEAEWFRKNVRNGIIHDTETRGRCVIQRGAPSGGILTTKCDSISLNRNAFHGALIRELGAWLAKLRAGDKVLRSNMKLRMNQIIRRHGETVE